MQKDIEKIRKQIDDNFRAIPDKIRLYNWGRGFGARRPGQRNMTHQQSRNLERDIEDLRKDIQILEDNLDAIQNILHNSRMVGRSRSRSRSGSRKRSRSRSRSRSGSRKRSRSRSEQKRRRKKIYKKQRSAR